MTQQVSVIIPTYNRVALLEGAINSARTASASVEIIVVDNGSKDLTPQFCRGLTGITYVRREINEGPSKARNIGIAKSNSDYLAFLDDDDQLLPESLDSGLALLRDHPAAAVCYGRVALSFGTGDPTGEIFPTQQPDGDVFRNLLVQNFIVVNAALVRRAALLEVGMFNEHLFRNEDWDLWVRLAERYMFVATTQIIGIVRRPNESAEQLSSDRKAMHRASSALQQHWLELPRAAQLSVHDRRQLRNTFCRNSSWLLASAAAESAKQHDYWKASQQFGAAFRIHPVAAITRLFATFRGR